MKFKSTIILILFFNILSVKTLYSENNYSGFSFTLSTGPSYITGFYKDFLTGGSSTGFNTYYNFPFFISNTYFNSGLFYNHYFMALSSDSILSQYDIFGGFGIFYSLLSFLDI